MTNSSLLMKTKVWNQELVEEIEQTSVMIHEQLNNTLDISKLEEGKTEFNKSFELVRNVIEFALEMHKSEAQKRQIQLRSEYEDNIPLLVEIDKARVIQIMVNLLGNAIKFTPEHGTITVRVRWKPHCQCIKEESAAEIETKESMVNSTLMKKISIGSQNRNINDDLLEEDYIPDEFDNCDQIYIKKLSNRLYDFSSKIIFYTDLECPSPPNIIINPGSDKEVSSFKLLKRKDLIPSEKDIDFSVNSNTSNCRRSKYHIYK